MKQDKGSLKMETSVSKFSLIRKSKKLHHVLPGLGDVTAVTKALQEWAPNVSPQNESDYARQLGGMKHLEPHC